MDAQLLRFLMCFADSAVIRFGESSDWLKSIAD